ncbi:hypothetical protein B0T24DRAFT_591977 [Lasiosphaeria ovina]|uniref:Uncharacterized protein n=1 Tax=Lasiosphaeria ovina TaxID=92902 RepID=A0AAE0KGF9_9PEZI|nr:hypothetical protein B0T24DRAFT_591977 [Lasiosphaeria ovina]
MFLNLCGEMDCAKSNETYWQTAADPDVAGIGIILSLLSMTALSHVAFVVAYFSFGLPQAAYTTLDTLVVAHVRSKWFRLAPVPAEPDDLRRARVAGFEAFILSLSDQSLIIGIAILVAVFTQLCSISTFSMIISSDLAFFASSAHLLTLVALREYFSARGRERWLRIPCMVALVALLRAAFLLRAFAADPQKSLACAVQSSEFYDLSYELSYWVAVTFIFINAYYRFIPQGSKGHSWPTGGQARMQIRPWISNVLTGRHPGFKQEMKCYLVEQAEKQKDGEIEIIDNWVALYQSSYSPCLVYVL